MMFVPSITLAAALLALSGSVANAHGAHADQPPSSDWATRHMNEEHHIDSFDPGSFFALHDYDNSGAWTLDEVRKTYGLDDESNAGVSEDRKQQGVREVFALFDPTNTGVISRDNWMRLISSGTRLPDLGFGPGHHGDIEYEYEIHHFEKYHGDDATEEELNHPEDIEHFRRHDEEELAAERLEQLERTQIVENNIPQKFRRKI
ncbi:EF hand domain-containing protein [Aspergillus taichungensis]|uniref:EF hand domain-containing protein n=1 Tax=Aspergillus taichungensis TaxID=482145 RepID=A0A2J5HPZ1_9EURO|nr:EF hand domain-containing protein [Aspergillus taichungensis]